MRCLKCNIPIKSTSDQVIIIPMGDIHLGYVGVDEKKLDGFVEFIRTTPNVRWIGMGDYIEAINLSDARFDPSGVAKWCRDSLDDLVKTQSDYFIKKIWPIRDKCLGLLAGNHEDVIRRKYHVDVMGHIGVETKIPILSSVAMLHVQFSIGRKSQSVKIFAMHGYGGCRTESASLNKILNKGKEFDADVYLMGHDHFLISQTKTQIVMSGGDNPRAIEQKRIFAVTGSFRLAYCESKYSDYAERQAYPPVRTGCHKITVTPFRHTKIERQDVTLRPDIHISE